MDALLFKAVLTSVCSSYKVGVEGDGGWPAFVSCNECRMFTSLTTNCKFKLCKKLTVDLIFNQIIYLCIEGSKANTCIWVSVQENFTHWVNVTFATFMKGILKSYNLLQPAILS